MVTQLAQRLSEASVKKSFDPMKTINWEEPFDLTRFYAKEEDISLYGTAVYESLSREEKVRLSLHEVASLMATGIWFENILKHKFIAYLYDHDPNDANFRYMLHEVADECRHSMMFGEFVRRSGVPFYRVRWWAKWGGQFLKEAPVPRSAVFVGILAAEEITDFFNRRAMIDPDVHPIVRDISRIHVIEEARHISYARSHLTEGFPRLGRAKQVRVSLLSAIVTGVIVSQLVSPDVYPTVGLPADAARLARENPHRRALLREGGRKFVTYLEGIGLIRPSTRWAWKATRLVG